MRFCCRTISQCLILTLLCASVHADEPLQPLPDFSAVAGPLLASFCNDCHTGESAESGLAFDKLATGDDFQRDRQHWLHVVRRLRAGDMPPADSQQPTEAEREQLVDWLAARLELVDCSGPPEPGHITLRRLTREQYQNTIRDLLGVDFNATEVFPPDQLGYGFDNNGDVLSLSPLLLEKYLTAADAIATNAVPAAENLVDGGKRMPLSEGDGISRYDEEGRMLFTNATVATKLQPWGSGRYAFRITVSGNQAGDDPVRLSFALDDRTLPVIDLLADDNESESFFVLADVGDNDEPQISVSFLNDFYDSDGRSRKKGRGRDRNLIVHSIETFGPLNLTADAPAPARRMLLSSAPTPQQWQSGDEWQGVARDRLRTFVPHAFRKEVGEDEVDRLIELMQGIKQIGGTYERALQLAVQATLMSPQFLFVGDENPRLTPPSNEPLAKVDDFVLASRLSYFIWGSLPDDELLSLADRHLLHKQLPAQVHRMLRDKRAAHLADSFGGQWLETRQLEVITPDATTFPEFDAELRTAMAREAREFIAAIVTQDLPITTLLDADFTFLNERLAKHYGIDGVAGDYFRRVELTAEQQAAGRGGVLGLGSVLTVTSNPDRSSPVLRGKFILAKLLGDEPPPPPPNVPPLEEGGAANVGTVRQRLLAHQQNVGCASCHKQIDPLGFALESFDAVGRSRTTDAGQPIDDTGTLPDGTSFRGAAGLRELLVSRRDEFRHAFAEKLMTFGLGRGLEYYDQCAVREAVEVSAEHDDRFSAMVLAIVESTPFLYEQPREALSQGSLPQEAVR